MHKGIRYFRNAFFFYGLAFVTRYFLSTPFFLDYLSLIYHFRIKFLFEFFLVMAGFFLLYSLLWKKIESQKIAYSSSLFNPYILIFYLMAFIIAFIDYLWDSYYLLFYSQFILFIILFILSISKLYQKPSAGFLKIYSIAMLCGLTAWLLNALAGIYFQWNYTALMIIYSLNIIVFLLFLFGVIKITNSR
jgi:hypothetical protein